MQTESLQNAVEWRDYYELTKPRVVLLIVFTAIVGTRSVVNFAFGGRKISSVPV